MSRRVTLHGSAQATAFSANSNWLRQYVRDQLIANGIGVVSLEVGSSIFNSLVTFDVTINALDHQSVAEVEAIVTQAFRNIAASTTGAIEAIYNMGPFRVTSGHWGNASGMVGGVFGGGGNVPSPTRGNTTFETMSDLLRQNWTLDDYISRGYGVGVPSSSSSDPWDLGFDDLGIMPGSTTPTQIPSHWTVNRFEPYRPFDLTKWLEENKNLVLLGGVAAVLLLTGKK